MARQSAIDDGWLAETSVRAVADELDVASNTAVRAMRLRAGINGHFDHDTYGLIVPTDVSAFCLIYPSTTDPDHKPQAPALPSKPRQSPLTVEQLQLFPQG